METSGHITTRQDKSFDFDNVLWLNACAKCAVTMVRDKAAVDLRLR